MEMMIESRISTMKLLVISFCLTGILVAAGDTPWPVSVVTKMSGHYPSHYYLYTNVMLIPTRQAFVTRNELKTEPDVFSGKVWMVESDPGLTTDQCDEMFDEGHAFTFFYHYGKSNYFHLHYDTAIPLYKAVHHHDNRDNIKRAFLPTVETSRLQPANWKTDAYIDGNKEKYWAQIIRAVTGEYPVIPLDQNLEKSNRTICFKQLYLGSVSWKNRKMDSSLIHGFVSHVQHVLGVTAGDPEPTKIGIIQRTNRRRILNEPELIEALNEIAPTELINFDGKTFREQVQLMQDYRVVLGLNGAGLMNCLYLAPSSVCIQLVPYKAELNFGPYGELLSARGGYREWHNTHAENHVQKGVGSHSVDTIVDVKELATIVKEAVTMATKAMHEKKEEL